MGTNLDPIPPPDTAALDPVTWIGRDRPSPERVTPAEPLASLSPAAGRAGGARGKWLVIGAVLVALALILFIASKLFGGHKIPATTLAERGGEPLVSVIVPALQPVTSSVTFTGAIAARYDMPIANEGDTGRIVAVYVEAGDHVKRGQMLAKIDDSVAVQEVNRLAASLEQAKAQAAMSAAEYKRAQGVEAAGALSAEDIEQAPCDIGDRCRQRQSSRRAAGRVCRRASSAAASRRRSMASCSRAALKSARSPPRAARRCSASPAAGRSRCAARSPSRTWRR